MSDLLASLFGTDAVENDALHAPLTPQEGRIAGVGVRLCLIHDPPLCVPAAHYTYLVAVGAVGPGTPAARAGLAPGDLIAAVDGRSLDYGRQVYLPDDVAALLRGPAGTAVEVTVQRAGATWTLRLVREVVGAVWSPAGAWPATPEQPRRGGAPVTPDGARRPDALGSWRDGAVQAA